MNKYQEAIENVKVDNKSYCIDYCFNKDNAYEKRELHEKGLNVLQELVEKATSKKVLFTESDADRYYQMDACPNCLFRFKALIIMDKPRYYKKALRYCPACGQALSWSQDLDFNLSDTEWEFEE